MFGWVTSYLYRSSDLLAPSGDLGIGGATLTFDGDERIVVGGIISNGTGTVKLTNQSSDNLRQAPAARISPANVFQLVFFFIAPAP